MADLYIFFSPKREKFDVALEATGIGFSVKLDEDGAEMELVYTLRLLDLNLIIFFLFVNRTLSIPMMATEAITPIITA